MASVQADRASTEPGWVVDLKVRIAGFHPVGVVSSRGLAADRARNNLLHIRQAVVGAIEGAVIVAVTLEASRWSARHTLARTKSKPHSLTVRAAG